MLRYIVVLISFIVFMSPSTYASRLALVIGNNDYIHESSLSSPVNDARDMATVLRGLGFTVIDRYNLKQRDFEQVVQSFEKQLHKYNVGLFYYSGHGLQAQSDNYLVPIDARIQSPVDIKYTSINANRILEKMEYANKHTNLLILDACRDNPFKSIRKGFSKGLAEMSPRGSLIAFATAPGTTALDGSPTKRNSIYTKHLLRQLRTQPHLSVSDLLTQVAGGVAKETNRKQWPWKSDSLTERFCFGSCGSGESGKLERQRIDLERQRIDLERQRSQLKQEKDRQKKEQQHAEERQHSQLKPEKVPQEETKIKPNSQSLLFQSPFFLPKYRYTDNGDGTVTDNRSGLIWLKNANCFGPHNWKKAMQSAANLASGQCGLRDGSRRGMWRLPTREEWEAMVDEKYMDRENYSRLALSNAAGTGPWKEGDAFSGVQTDGYWSSTTYAGVTTQVWFVDLIFAFVGYYDKTKANYVWPVR